MLTETTIRQAIYGPELLPAAEVVTVPAVPASYPVLNVRNWGTQILRLQDLYVDSNAAVNLDLSNGSANALGNATALWGDGSGVRVEAQGVLRATVSQHTPNPITGYRTRFGLWVQEPSVLQSLALGRHLSPSEQQIADAFELASKLGSIPDVLDPSRETDRYTVFQVLPELYQVDLTAGVPYELPTINVDHPGQEFWALQGIAADTGAAADAITIQFGRDTTSGYFSLDAYALPGFDTVVGAWVPFTSSLNITVTAANDVAGYRVRLLVARVRYTDVLKAKWDARFRANASLALQQRALSGVA